MNIHVVDQWQLKQPWDGSSRVNWMALSLITTHTLQLEKNGAWYNTRPFWELKSLGIHLQFPNKDPVSDLLKEGRYEVSLSWREYHDPLPSNYNLLCRCLCGLMWKLREEPTILWEYDDIMHQQSGSCARCRWQSGDDPPFAKSFCNQLRQENNKGESRVWCLIDPVDPHWMTASILVQNSIRKFWRDFAPIQLLTLISMAPKDCDVLRFLWLKLTYDLPE